MLKNQINAKCSSKTPLNELRKIVGITTQQLAENCELSYSTIRRMCQKNEFGKYGNIKKIEDAVNICCEKNNKNIKVKLWLEDEKILHFKIKQY